MQWDVRL